MLAVLAGCPSQKSVILTSPFVSPPPPNQLNIDQLIFCIILFINDPNFADLWGQNDHNLVG